MMQERLRADRAVGGFRKVDRGQGDVCGTVKGLRVPMMDWLMVDWFMVDWLMVDRVMVDWLMMGWIMEWLWKMRRQIWMRGGKEFQVLERVCLLRVLCRDSDDVGVVQVPGDRRRRDDRQ